MASKDRKKSSTPTPLEIHAAFLTSLQQQLNALQANDNAALGSLWRTVKQLADAHNIQAQKNDIVAMGLTKVIEQAERLEREALEREAERQSKVINNIIPAPVADPAPVLAEIQKLFGWQGGTLQQTVEQVKNNLISAERYYKLLELLHINKEAIPSDLSKKIADLA